MQIGSISLPLDIGFGNRTYADQWSVSGSVKAMRSSMCFCSLSCDYAYAWGENVPVSLLFQEQWGGMQSKFEVNLQTGAR